MRKNPETSNHRPGSSTDNKNDGILGTNIIQYILGTFDFKENTRMVCIGYYML